MSSPRICPCHRPTSYTARTRCGRKGKDCGVRIIIVVRGKELNRQLEQIVANSIGFGPSFQLSNNQSFRNQRIQGKGGDSAYSTLMQFLHDYRLKKLPWKAFHHRQRRACGGQWAVNYVNSMRVVGGAQKGFLELRLAGFSATNLGQSSYTSPDWRCISSRETTQCLSQLKDTKTYCEKRVTSKERVSP